MTDHVDQKDLHVVCSRTKDMNMKQTCFHHSVSKNYDLDLQASNMILA